MRHIFRYFTVMVISCISLNVLAADTEEQEEQEQSLVQKIVTIYHEHPKAVRIGLGGTMACIGYFLGGKKLLTDLSMQSGNDAAMATVIDNSPKLAKIGVGFFAGGALFLAGEALKSCHELIAEITEIDTIDD